MFYDEFQSTPPVRKATIKDTYNYYKNKISIHASREEGDFMTFT